MFDLIAGPCVIESRDMAMRHAERLTQIIRYPTEHGPGTDAIRHCRYYFKASYDKANRTNIHSFRGVGIERGLAILAEIKQTFGLAVTTDVHTAEEATIAGEVVDMIQIPAFLCRQTDLLTAAALTGKMVNVKKAPFIGPSQMASLVEKLRVAGCRNIYLTERGTTFGYERLVVDYRTLLRMKDLDNCRVAFDATHSLQAWGEENVTQGSWRDAEAMARAALAIGVHALFFETHENPKGAKSDAATQIPLSEFCPMMYRLYAFSERIAG